MVGQRIISIRYAHNVNPCLISEKNSGRGGPTFEDPAVKVKILLIALFNMGFEVNTILI